MRLLIRRFLVVFLVAAMFTSMFWGVEFENTSQSYADSYMNDTRAAWIVTLPQTASTLFPITQNDISAQKADFIKTLDALKACGINTVVVQVRSCADALYKSSINPWSAILTGTQGKDPGYDPMAFMIEEAHNRGMSFHAWLNPYRVSTPNADITTLSANHPAVLHPEWTITYKNALYYNPDLPEVEQHICDTVAEIVDNYSVDGIHFDDYFYPSGYPLPSGESRDGAVANARRAITNQMVAAVSNTIKTHKPSVVFGISPIGIWKNSKSDPSGSATNGGEGYYSVFGDAVSWVKAGTVDYITPQIYWQIGHAQADYETLVSWWSNLVKDTNVSLYIGEGIYRDQVASEIDEHLKIDAKYDQVKGNFYYSAKDILTNRQGCADKLTSYYSQFPSENITPPVTTLPETSSFTDVAKDAWYFNDVQAAVRLKIIDGMGNGTFDPSGNLTVAQAITLAVKEHNYVMGTSFVGGGVNWYDNAVNYAVEKGIIQPGDFLNYDGLISREQMAYIFSNTLLSSDNSILNSEVIVPDIEASLYKTSIQKLYIMGILTGTGSDRAFSPATNISRAEAAAIINRVATPSNRIDF